ncbi:Guanine-nucleotide dissociation stimulator CDC25 [Penicillium chermesinum]|nr:Guanine-nucleotide dissociation stimulator CDC25 [Penicillium chermesinum]
MKPIISPLNIAKSNYNISAVTTFDPKSTTSRYYSNPGRSETTPPMTPHTTDTIMEQPELEPADEPPRAVFHNYLRAFYPFHPAATSRPRPSLFLWIREISSWSTLFTPMAGPTDLMRGPIAGVRFLLEKSECLTREAPLVKRYDGLRRIRKALLSDLSSLVKAAKRFQEVANGGNPAEDEIVTRGVRFLDVWNEEVGLSRTIAELEAAGGGVGAHKLPPTPSSETFNDADSMAIDQVTERNESQQTTRGRLDTSRLSDHPPRPISVTTKRISVSHRVSYSGPSAAIRTQNLASERLGTTYDAFLGVLGSFIGLHMQSRSSTELVRNTFLEQTRDVMCDKLDELVHAARDVFRPAHLQDDDLVFMPDGGSAWLMLQRTVSAPLEDEAVEPASTAPCIVTSEVETPEQEEKPQELSLRLPPPPSLFQTQLTPPLPLASPTPLLLPLPIPHSVYRHICYLFSPQFRSPSYTPRADVFFLFLRQQLP